MVNLIIDLSLHAPNLKYVIKNSLYYGEEKGINFTSNHTNNDIISKYKFDLYEEKKQIMKLKSIDNFFFVITVLSTEVQHQGESAKKWIDMYKYMYNKFYSFVTGKIVLIDNHGGDYEPNIYLNKFNFNYDIILKRIYSNRNKHRYSKNTFSYPLITPTKDDPLYKLYNSNMIITPIANKINKIFFAGSLFDYHEEWDNKNTCEHADRRIIINNIKKKNILEITRVSYNIFHKTISNYKYALDVRGTSRLNKRLYEILSTNTLLLAEKIDIVWPFENDDKFSDECFFEQGNPDDLYRIYNNFEKDNELYKKCLENQLYIAKKYFNNEWIWDYIENIIK